MPERAVVIQSRGEIVEDIQIALAGFLEMLIDYAERKGVAGDEWVTRLPRCLASVNAELDRLPPAPRRSAPLIRLVTGGMPAD